MTAKILSLQTPAKINPVLEVLGKRADGYHELALVFQSVGLYDQLSFSEKGQGVSLSVDGLSLAADDSNLVVKAAKLFLKEVLREDRGIHVSLQKRIPLAAGMGGGSSDAAATLRGLDLFWGTQTPENILWNLAAELGSDVPFFLTGGTALGTGRGEKITPWAAGPEIPLVLVKPEQGLSTPAVYRSGKALVTSGERASGFEKIWGSQDKEKIAKYLFNGLEPAAFFLMPEVEQIKRRLIEAGASGALVSGSGPTVFAMAETPSKAQEIARRMEGRGLSVWATKTISTGVQRI